MNEYYIGLAIGIVLLTCLSIVVSRARKRRWGKKENYLMN